MARTAGELGRVTDLLGGEKAIRRRVHSRLDAHELILAGLPADALTHLVKRVGLLNRPSALDKAIGISLRTYQRRKQGDRKPLNPEQSGRAWKFAEILARASEVFGSQARAEAWLGEPVLGLDRRRPLDLIATPAGVELVEDHLGRIAHGVYT